MKAASNIIPAIDRECSQRAAACSESLGLRPDAEKLPDGSKVEEASSHCAKQDHLPEHAYNLPTAAGDLGQATQANDIIQDEVLEGAVNLPTLSTSGELSADPEATNQGSTSNTRGGDIKQFLDDDEDMWRFQGKL